MQATWEQYPAPWILGIGILAGTVLIGIALALIEFALGIALPGGGLIASMVAALTVGQFTGLRVADFMEKSTRWKASWCYAGMSILLLLLLVILEKNVAGNVLGLEALGAGVLLFAIVISLAIGVRSPICFCGVANAVP